MKLNVIKISKIVLLLSIFITVTGYLIVNEITTSVGLCLFFGALAIYCFITSMNNKADPYDEYDDYYGI